MQQRQRIRLAGYDYSRDGAYFLTVCTRGRSCIFGEVVAGVMRPNALGRLVDACWRDLTAHFDGLTLDAFVVMPNHVHAILLLHRAGQARPLHVRGSDVRVATLPGVVGAFKAAASRRAGRPFWQRGYFDRIIRNEAELEALRRYIAENPLRWGVERAGQVRPLRLQVDRENPPLV